MPKKQNSGNYRRVVRILFLFFILLIGFQSFAEEAAPPPKPFKDESEFGAAVVSGNTNTETYNLKQFNQYSWDKNALKLSGRYLEARANGVQSAESWEISLRYERVLSDLVTVFAGYGLQSDPFAGYVQKNNADVGAKHFLSKDPDFNWFAEAGYRNTKTHYTGVQEDSENSSFRLYTEANKYLNKSENFRLWIEYVQTFFSTQTGNHDYLASQDYQVNVEPSMTVLLTQVLSLKVAYLFKYNNYLAPDSTATKHLDTLFTTSLVAKF